MSLGLYAKPRASQIEKFQSRIEIDFFNRKRSISKIQSRIHRFQSCDFQSIFQSNLLQNSIEFSIGNSIEKTCFYLGFLGLSSLHVLCFLLFCRAIHPMCFFFCFLGLASPHGHLLSFLSFNTLLDTPAVFPMAFPKICRKRLSSLDSSQKRLSSLISSACRHLAILTFHPPQPFSTNCQRVVGPPYALKNFFRQSQNQGIEFLGQEFF